MGNGEKVSRLHAYCPWVTKVADSSWDKPTEEVGRLVSKSNLWREQGLGAEEAWGGGGSNAVALVGLTGGSI